MGSVKDLEILEKPSNILLLLEEDRNVTEIVEEAAVLRGFLG